MKLRSNTLVVLAGAFVASACASAGGAGGAAPQAGPAAAAVRAAAGDTIYLVEHHVRPERRQQFEDFVYEVLWPAFERSAGENAARRNAARQLRLLGPVRADADGSLTFAFLLDPVVAGERYDVLQVLRETHDEAEAVRLYARFTETWAREFTARPFVQFRGPGSQ